MATSGGTDTTWAAAVVKAQVPQLRAPLMISLAAAIIPLAILLILALLRGTDLIGLAMRDVPAIAKLHSLTGVFSNLGAFLLFASATLCFFTRTHTRHILDRHTLSFLGWGGLLSIYLWFDDFFLFHERLARGIGLHEKMVVAALGLWVAMFVYRF